MLESVLYQTWGKITGGQEEKESKKQPNQTKKMRRKADDDDDPTSLDLISSHNTAGNTINDFWWSGVHTPESERMDE